MVERSIEPLDHFQIRIDFNRPLIADLGFWDEKVRLKRLDL